MNIGPAGRKACFDRVKTLHESCSEFVSGRPVHFVHDGALGCLLGCQAADLFKKRRVTSCFCCSTLLGGGPIGETLRILFANKIDTEWQRRQNNDDYGTVNHNLKQVPLTMAYCEDHHTLVTASADMTLLQWYLDDIPSIKHYTIKSRWPTKHAAMSMCWSSSHRLLYSGTTAGTIQGTRCEEGVGLVFQRRFVLLFKRQFSSTSTLTPWRRASEILKVFLSRGRHLILFRPNYMCLMLHRQVIGIWSASSPRNSGVSRSATTQHTPLQVAYNLPLPRRLGYRRATRNGDIEGTLGYRHGNDGHARARQPGFG